MSRDVLRAYLERELPANSDGGRDLVRGVQLEVYNDDLNDVLFDRFPFPFRLQLLREILHEDGSIDVQVHPVRGTEGPLLHLYRTGETDEEGHFDPLFLLGATSAVPGRPSGPVDPNTPLEAQQRVLDGLGRYARATVLDADSWFSSVIQAAQDYWDKTGSVGPLSGISDAGLRSRLAGALGRSEENSVRVAAQDQEDYDAFLAKLNSPGGYHRLFEVLVVEAAGLLGIQLHVIMPDGQTITYGSAGDPELYVVLTHDDTHHNHYMPALLRTQRSDQPGSGVASPVEVTPPPANLSPAPRPASRTPLPGTDGTAAADDSVGPLSANLDSRSPSHRRAATAGIEDPDTISEEDEESAGEPGGGALAGGGQDNGGQALREEIVGELGAEGAQRLRTDAAMIIRRELLGVPDGVQLSERYPDHSIGRDLPADEELLALLPPDWSAVLDEVIRVLLREGPVRAAAVARSRRTQVPPGLTIRRRVPNTDEVEPNRLNARQRQTLRRLGRYARWTPPDGDCWFSSVLRAVDDLPQRPSDLSGIPRLAVGELRSIMAEHAATDPVLADGLRSLYEGNTRETYEQFVAGMRTRAHWESDGYERVLYLAGRLLGLHIVVIDPAGRLVNTGHDNPNARLDLTDGRPVIYLVQGTNHYLPALPLP
jgi:hypothetical protein